MREALAQQLITRYPNIYGFLSTQFDCGDGWFAILDILGRQLELVFRYDGFRAAIHAVTQTHDTLNIESSMSVSPRRTKRQFRMLVSAAHAILRVYTRWFPTPDWMLRALDQLDECRFKYWVTHIGDSDNLIELSEPVALNSWEVKKQIEGAVLFAELMSLKVCWKCGATIDDETQGSLCVTCRQ